MSIMTRLRGWLYDPRVLNVDVDDNELLVIYKNKG